MNRLMQVFLLCMIAAPALAADPVRSVLIASEVPFANKDLIDSAILAECNLPARQTELLSTALLANGIAVQTTKEPDSRAAANVLKLQIASATSGGNAFIGHFKAVTVTGTLFQNGQEIGSFVATRKSSGGAFAGFKGSCAVLGRCIQTIGQDVAKWLAAPAKGSRIGDAR